MRKLICGVILFVAISVVSLTRATPTDDLASTDQNVRDVGAKILRSSYVAPPRAKWEALLARLKPGLDGKTVRSLLQPYRSEGVDSSGGGTTSTYRLDDAWTVIVGTDDRDDGALTFSQLASSIRQVWIDPPKNYTGTWTTYHVNGQKSSEIQYRSGVYFGEFVSYHSNGTRGYVQHYDATGCNGDDTGYFPDGHIEYRAHYMHGQPDGIWTWYRRDGTVSSTQDHTK